MSNQLLQVKENQTVTTSLKVAEIFNKNHKDVLRKIDSIIYEIETGAKLRSLDYFEKSEEKDSHGQFRPMYFINRDGFTLLAMGFTGKEALEWKLKYIQAFNEMEKVLRSGSSSLPDNRLEIAQLIIQAPRYKVSAILELYPEYFSQQSTPGSLEYLSDLNTSYLKWIEECGITKEWVEYFPTSDIYNNYIRFCTENKFRSMGKKIFYATLENDFRLTKRQRANGHRYFISA